MASTRYLDRPFFGSRRMAVTLGVGRTRIRRLMRILGIEAHYPKRNLSRPVPGHEIYPYLLRGVSIEWPNQVCSTDITYLPAKGADIVMESIALTVRAPAIYWLGPPSVNDPLDFITMSAPST